MQPAAFYQTLQPDTAALRAVGFNPYYRPLGGLRGGRTQIDGRAYFDLASNDYLGLAGDARVQEAMIEAVREYGASLCGTPIATGSVRILAALTSEIAEFIGLEAAVVLPSGYQANTALFPALAAPGDVIIVDHHAHASLIQGIKAVGCKVKPFLHNDLDHLERQLASAGTFRQRFVVTESVFSTDGSVAPLGAMVTLCDRYGAIPVVDDSHGLGVLGASGRGIIEDQGLAGYNGLYTASLGKALANAGGVIAGARACIDALRYTCAGLIYSTALPPASVAGVRRALELVRAEFPARRERMRRHHARLVAKLQERGFALRLGEAPIASIRGGSTESTLALAKRFFAERLLATPFVPPSVPPDGGVLRLIVGAKLDDAGLAEVAAALDRLDGNDGGGA